MKTVVLMLIICFINAKKCDKSVPKFEVEYHWTFINYTWENEAIYYDAINTKKYIPENNAMAGIKYYKEKFYIALPRICTGTPVTLGFIKRELSTPKLNPLITPFPDWKSNNFTENCDNFLENVQSMEIDTSGIMWVIDGLRRSTSKCPPKLVLYDLTNNSIVETYTFPEQICQSNGGFLNDIVIDESDGAFAYITDHSSVDPGLIIYSRAKKHAWKIRDSTMFPELSAANFVVDNVIFSSFAPIDGIALSAVNSPSRNVYFCALTGFNLYSINTGILKSEELCSGGDWRVNVTYIGKKQAQSDGMVMDNRGDLYYGLLPLYGVGKWNSDGPISEAEIVDQNNDTMIWTDSFSFDDQGYLYLLANNIHKYFSTQCNFNSTENQNYTKFRILKYFTGTQSYLY